MRRSALHGFALGRESWLFVSSERGADSAAIMATRSMAAKLNDLDPQAWLAEVLARITSTPPGRLNEVQSRSVRFLPFARIGTGVSSACIGSAAKTWLWIVCTRGIRVAAEAPTQSASVDTSSAFTLVAGQDSVLQHAVTLHFP